MPLTFLIAVFSHKKENDKRKLREVAIDNSTFSYNDEWINIIGNMIFHLDPYSYTNQYIVFGIQMY